MKHLQSILSIAALLAITGSAQAAMVNYNTGQGALGSVDPNWELTAIAPPNPPGGDSMPDTFVIGHHPAWIQNDATSKWISYTAPRNDAGDIFRTYTYTLNFYTIGGDDLAFRWSSDNASRLYLDNTLVSTLAGEQAYKVWQSFPLDLSAGNHTIAIQVENFAQAHSPNPTAVRVEFAAPVPEPSTVLAGALLLLPFGASTLRKLRSKKS